MSAPSVEPPSTLPGRFWRRGAAATILCALLACLAAAAAAGQASPRLQPSTTDPQRPQVGAPAPDCPLLDGRGGGSSLRQVLKEKLAVLVFSIGYT